MMLATFMVDLPTLINQTWIIPHRHIQVFVSKVILGPINCINCTCNSYGMVENKTRIKNELIRSNFALGTGEMHWLMRRWDPHLLWQVQQTGAQLNMITKFPRSSENIEFCFSDDSSSLSPTHDHLKHNFISTLNSESEILLSVLDIAVGFLNSTAQFLCILFCWNYFKPRCSLKGFITYH